MRGPGDEARAASSMDLQHRAATTRGRPCLPAEPARTACYDLDLMRERVVMARLLRGGEKDDGRFDIDFWQRQGAEAIFAASWDLVNEARAMRGLHGDEPRLQRSLCRLVRRGR